MRISGNHPLLIDVENFLLINYSSSFFTLSVYNQFRLFGSRRSMEHSASTAKQTKLIGFFLLPYLAGHDEYITDAMCELGRSYMRTDQPKLALQNFVKYLNLSREILDYDGICNAHMELAFAYKV